MARSEEQPDCPRPSRTRVVLAALTGVLAGITRAVADWLLKHLGG
ncbi:hypothetical protein O7627_33505 [Solwaraspora sp. WMMD1047]|nr:hypothetical protein [Solwaraspora sp. WMMD1047]MDG4834184.1 hypothetical protein [Solwaraspora sp. WMMD1047]